MEPEEPEISGEHWARIQDVEGYTSVYPQLSAILISMNLIDKLHTGRRNMT